MCVFDDVVVGSIGAGDGLAAGMCTQCGARDEREHDDVALVYLGHGRDGTDGSIRAWVYLLDDLYCRGCGMRLSTLTVDCEGALADVDDEELLARIGILETLSAEERRALADEFARES